MVEWSKALGFGSPVHLVDTGSIPAPGVSCFYLRLVRDGVRTMQTAALVRLWWIYSSIGVFLHPKWR